MMDWIEIVPSLISAGAAIVVSVITNTAQHRRLISDLEKRDELQAYRIEQLEKKVDKHNNLVDRTYHLEEESRLAAEKIKVANHRIDDLEKNRR